MKRSALALALLALACASDPSPGPPTPWHDLAAAEEAARSGDPERAARLLRDLVAREPDRRGPRLRLGLLLLDLGRPEAADVLAPLARPGDREALLALGEAELLRGRPDAALDALRIYAMDPGPPDARPYVLRARIAERTGDRETAAQAARQALVADPGNPEARRLLERLGSTEAVD